MVCGLAIELKERERVNESSRMILAAQLQQDDQKEPVRGRKSEDGLRGECRVAQ